MAAILEAAKKTLASASNVTVAPAFLNGRLVDYAQVTATSSMSSGLPRFGHSRNFSQLFLQQEDNGGSGSAAAAQNDYIEGLMFAGACVLAIFMTWSLVLIGFKVWGSCCCRSSSSSAPPSVLSGQPFTYCDEDEQQQQQQHSKSLSSNANANANTDDDSARMQRWERRATRSRIAFLVSGLVLIIFAILFVSQGLQQVEQTRQIADTSLDSVRVLMDEATILAEDLRDVGATAIGLRNKLVKELAKDRLCPNDPNYLAQDEIGNALNANAGAAIDMLELLGEFATKDIQQMEDGLTQGHGIVNDIDFLVEAAGENEWVGIAFAIPLVTLTALLMVGAMAAQGHVMNDCGHFTLSWIILPLFVVWIVTSYFLCAGIAISASANADFCSGGDDMTPDSTILMSARNAGIEESSVEYEIARYYLKQCTEDAQVDPFLFLRTHDAEIASAKTIVLELTKSLQTIDVATLSFQCGRDYEPLVASLDTMMSILNGLEKSAEMGLSLLSCERIVPIYADIVYDGTCNYSVTGFTWMFSSLLVISAMGMIMIMLRSSYHNNVNLSDANYSGSSGGNDPTDEDSELNSMHYVNNNNNNNNHRSVRRRSSADSNAYDLQLREERHYREQAGFRQDASESGSVYTDGNGELHVVEVDPSVIPHNLYDACTYAPSHGEDEYGEPEPVADPQHLYDMDVPIYESREQPNPTSADPSDVPQHMYDMDAPSYDTYGKPKATAPMAYHDC